MISRDGSVPHNQAKARRAQDFFRHQEIATGLVFAAFAHDKPVGRYYVRYVNHVLSPKYQHFNCRCVGNLYVIRI